MTPPPRCDLSDPSDLGWRGAMAGIYAGESESAKMGLVEVIEPSDVAYFTAHLLDIDESVQKILVRCVVGVGGTQERGAESVPAGQRLWRPRARACLRAGVVSLRRQDSCIHQLRRLRACAGTKTRTKRLGSKPPVCERVRPLGASERSRSSLPRPGRKLRYCSLRKSAARRVGGWERCSQRRGYILKLVFLMERTRRRKKSWSKSACVR